AARTRCTRGALATIAALLRLALLEAIRVAPFLARLLITRGAASPAAVDVAVGHLLRARIVAIGPSVCGIHSTTAPGSRRAPRAQSSAGIIFLPGGCTVPNRRAVVTVPTNTPDLR